MSIAMAPDRAWLEVDLAAIVRNARRFKALIGAPLLPMVKANAYGMGAVPVVRALEQAEPWGYGVATVEEGRELREAGIGRPIIVFTPLTKQDADVCRAAALRPVIGDLDALEAWIAAGDAPFHVEIDTGMSRSGFRWHDRDGIAALGEQVSKTAQWEGVFTHFHSADVEPTSMREQAMRFHGVLSSLGARPRLVHLANSAAAQLGDEHGGDLARPGIYLYGGRAGTLEPEPVAKLRARIVAVRRLRSGDTVSYGAEAKVPAPTTIATLSIGYGDGVPRALGNRGLVELHGAIVPIVGRVTMDMVMVDVKDNAVAVGDVATLFGGRIALDEQARLAGTVSYELLTSLTPRVARRYSAEP